MLPSPAAAATADTDVDDVSGGGVTVTGIAFVSVTGVQGNAQVGSVEGKANADVDVIGLSATGSVGQVLVYGRIVPDQNPNYTNITPNQSVNWTKIAA